MREGKGVPAIEEILRTGFVAHLFVSGTIKAILSQRPDSVAIEKPFREAERDRAIQRALDAADNNRTAKLATERLQVAARMKP